MPTAKTTFTHDAWDERPWHEKPEEPRLTKVTVKRSYSGDFEGSSQIEYLMTYLPTGIALYTGYERFEGKLGEREGSFVMRHDGAYRDNAAHTDWSIVEGSGTGGFAGVAGSGSNALGHAEQHTIELDLEFE